MSIHPTEFTQNVNYLTFFSYSHIKLNILTLLEFFLKLYEFLDFSLRKQVLSAKSAWFYEVLSVNQSAHPWFVLRWSLVNHLISNKTER